MDLGDLQLEGALVNWPRW